MIWLDRLRWWLWGRRRALARQRREDAFAEAEAERVRMTEELRRTTELRAEQMALLMQPDTHVGWVKKHYEAGIVDPSHCYRMRSVAELLGE